MLLHFLHAALRFLVRFFLFGSKPATYIIADIQRLQDLHFRKIQRMINKTILCMLLCCFGIEPDVTAQPVQGSFAKEIALPNATGDSIRLSTLRGKVVLLDFWASWCAPCRISNKGLVKIYSRFRKKGFEILGVSLDTDKEKWLRAIQKDKITWLQVNDPGGWNAPTAINWSVDAIPTSYLIDRDGRLLAMDLAGKPLEKALEKLLDDDEY